MEIEVLCNILGWLLILNATILSVSAVLLLLFRQQTLSIHSQLFQVEQKALNLLYLQYFALYKLLIIFFNLVPYLVLKLVY